VDCPYVAIETALKSLYGILPSLALSGFRVRFVDVGRIGNLWEEVAVSFHDKFRTTSVPGLVLAGRSLRCVFCFSAWLKGSARSWLRTTFSCICTELAADIRIRIPAIVIRILALRPAIRPIAPITACMEFFFFNNPATNDIVLCHLYFSFSVSGLQLAYCAVAQNRQPRLEPAYQR
jgi:hypothetical protein